MVGVPGREARGEAEADLQKCHPASPKIPLMIASRTCIIQSDGVHHIPIASSTYIELGIAPCSGLESFLAGLSLVLGTICGLESAWDGRGPEARCSARGGTKGSAGDDR